ncbi:MAG: choice-of-anchor tandem repeat GloVer-containing protein [Candidatus Cybelea sp.]
MNKALVLLGCVSIAGCATGTGSTLPTAFTPNASSARHFQPLTRGGNPSPSNPTIYLFQGQPDGGAPYAGLVNVSGTLYGTTSAGGKHNLGTVFSVTPAGSETILHSFKGAPDGNLPYASLTYVRGKLYGTTYNGGTSNTGTVFSITMSGKEKVLHSFGSGSDGTSPQSDLFYHDGALYGTTYSGGANGAGTVFKVALSGAESVVYSFKAPSTDGRGPTAGVIYYQGAFYGTTYSGGIGTSTSDGTVFKLTPSGTETVLHTFTGNPDGSEPSGDLVEYGGNLYGTTYSGGSYSAPSDHGGTVFEITRKGKLTVLYSFGGPDSNVDQVSPQAGLLNVGGTFYGTVSGANAAGAVFAITPGSPASFVYQFNRNGPSGSPDQPLGGVINLSGTLYGTTVSNVGQAGEGTVFAVPL